MRPIDADALLQDMETACNRSQFGRATAKMCVKRATTADVVPVVRGEWVEHEYEMECPQCGYFWNYCDNDTERFNFCPNCGAKMEDKP